MTRLLRLLLLAATVCGPAAAYVSGREAKQQVNDVLTEKLFAVASLLTTVEEHVRKLESWDSSASTMEARLAALEAGQQRASEQLADALQRLESAAEGTAAVRAELTQVATSQASAATALDTLRTDLTKSLSDVGESVAGLASSHASQHEETRGACRAGDERLEAPLAELRSAVEQTAELAQRTESALSAGLSRVDAQLRETGEQLGQLSQELREERQARLTSTTPAPTVDPHQAFLNSLYRSLAKRRQDGAGAAGMSMAGSNGGD